MKAARIQDSTAPLSRGTWDHAPLTRHTTDAVAAFRTILAVELVDSAGARDRAEGAPDNAM